MPRFKRTVRSIPLTEISRCVINLRQDISPTGKFEMENEKIVRKYYIKDSSEEKHEDR
ncbi:MAG: hypothetical protein H6Q66_824 [Firmicutes bacterium]|nr:hypothetical protein [Bacillota bacterium]